MGIRQDMQGIFGATAKLRGLQNTKWFGAKRRARHLARKKRAVAKKSGKSFSWF